MRTFGLYTGGSMLLKDLGAVLAGNRIIPRLPRQRATNVLKRTKKRAMAIPRGFIPVALPVMMIVSAVGGAFETHFHLF